MRKGKLQIWFLMLFFIKIAAISWGYEPSRMDILKMKLNGAKIQVPEGEECLLDESFQAEYEGCWVKVNATSRRITFTGINVGWFTDDIYHLDFPYDSIIACRKFGKLSMYENSIYFITKNHRVYELAFNADLHLSTSPKLPSTYLLDCITKNVALETLPGYSAKWRFNSASPDFNGPNLVRLPIAFRMTKSRIPFGGYVGCVFNLLDREIGITVKVENSADEKYFTRVGDGQEMTFGWKELGKRLKAGDIIVIMTTENYYARLRVTIVKDGDFICDAYY